MDLAHVLNISAFVLSAAAAFGWLNVRWLKLPHTIAMVLLALGASFLLMAFDHFTGGNISSLFTEQLAEIQFDETLLTGMLSFLLFAGALHIDLALLLKHKWPILAMATLGVALSTAIVGVATYHALAALDMAVPLSWCLVFGALISPTDPVAVLAILKKVHLPPSLEVKIAGESLFNDGIGIVAFLGTLAFATADSTAPGHGDIAMLLLSEVGGGVLIGLAGGYVAFLAMRSIDEYSVEVLITLALVVGVYAACLAVHASGPLAEVMAGLMIGNHGRKYAMSERTLRYVQMFWTLVDDILNSALFLLIGFEVMVLGFDSRLLMAIAAAIPILLLARFVSVAIPLHLSSRRNNRAQGSIRILTWAGLRGGISIALALSLPSFPGRETLVGITYGVVIFSILAQGLTIERLSMRWAGEGKKKALPA